MQRYTITSPEAIGAEAAKLGMSMIDTANLVEIPYERLMSYATAQVATIEAPVLNALAAVLEIHPAKLARDYEAPEQVLTRVYPRIEMVFEYLNRTGINPNQLAKQTNVHPSVVYGFTRRHKKGCAASSAAKLAKGMGVPVEEFCPGLALYDPAES
jgi:hypothetical protein